VIIDPARLDGTKPEPRGSFEEWVAYVLRNESVVVLYPRADDGVQELGWRYGLVPHA
jgi:hypothetical protein